MIDIDHLFEPVEPVSERVSLPAFGTGRRAELRKRGRRRREDDAPRGDVSVVDEAAGGGPPSEPEMTLVDEPVVAPPVEEMGSPRRPAPVPEVLAPKSRRRRVAPRWGAMMMLVGLVMSGVALAGMRSGERTEPGAAPAPAAAPVPGEAPMATVLVAHDADGGGALITVLVAHEDGGGALVYVPTGAMAEIPSFGLEQLGRAVTLGGPELVRAGLENLFGVQMSDVVTVEVESLGDLAGSRQLDVDVPHTVEAVGESGRVEVLWAEGPARLDGSALGEFLTDAGDGTELELIVRHKAFWQALLASVAAGDAAPTGELAALAPILESVAAGGVAHHALPVEALGSDGDGAGLYRVDRAATAALVERTMRGAPAVDADARIRVQILNGTGEPGLARDVTVALVPAGAEVVVVDNADRFDYSATQIVYYDRDERARAEAIREVLGTGDLVLSRNRLDVVDVTVVVGRDFTG